MYGHCVLLPRLGDQTLAEEFECLSGIKPHSPYATPKSVALVRNRCELDTGFESETIEELPHIIEDGASKQGSTIVCYWDSEDEHLG